MTTPEPGTSYPDDVRRTILARYAATGSARKTAKETGVHFQTIYRWAEEARQTATPLRWRCCTWLLPIEQDCPQCGAKAPAMFL